VLAKTAAAADVAATLIANAVNIDSKAVTRKAASKLDPDTDLGDLPVTTKVGLARSQVLRYGLCGCSARNPTSRVRPSNVGLRALTI
jgi:ApbE superfamily uncharacterized protein (UPF0280 family)